MAVMQTPAADPTQATPAADPAQAAPEAQSEGGFTIELNVAADGSLSVSVEPASQEQTEAGDEESAQSVPNLAAAFKLIKEIVAQGGEMADAGAGADQMAGGYSSTGM